MRHITAILAVFLIVSACSTKNNTELRQGVWRGVIDIQGQDLPFNFTVVQDSAQTYRAFVKNADENLLLDEIRIEGDSVIFRMHIFDSELKVRPEGDSLKGFFIKTSEKNYRLPFKAAFNQDFRFGKNDNTRVPQITGKYEVTFFNPSDTTEAIGIFKNGADNIVTGTFLTSTGDYRYLEGNIINDTIHLSTFDGNHAYVFKAVQTSDSTLTGEFWSGKTRYQKWIGRRNPNAALPDPGSLTWLKEGYEKIDFSFPDTEGKQISLSDDKFKNKVVILQLSGTWCPNCMDETKFLAPWYKENKDRGVEIIGLSYESRDDFDYASDRVRKMKSRLGVTYDFVIAGTRNKESAANSLPMLNQVAAFPTTIFIGKDGKVKYIHTGFSGPGTGSYYQEFIEHFNEKVNELLK